MKKKYRSTTPCFTRNKVHGYPNFRPSAIGNLVSDASEYISAIDWDLHGKVRHVHRATNPHNLAELKFWYDGTGNRIHKQSIIPGSAGGPDVLHDEWYVRDPQGNEMAVYERQIEDGWLVTRLKEHPIYGADRLGLDLNGVVISRLPIGEGDPQDATGDPAGKHALVIGEIMYDSPTTGDDFPGGKEYKEGEYLVLINKSGIDLDLSAYTLHAGNDSLPLTDTLAAGERIILGFGENAAEFAQLVALPAEWEPAVRMQNTLRLHDRGGIVSVVHQSGAPIDEFSYGNFYNLSAENPYLADSLIDSLGQRSSLKSVQPDAYGGGVSLGGAVAFGEGAVGDIEPGIDPEPTEKAVWGKYTLHRGRKVYELKNHLGNVLAVVSDVKIGVDLQLVNVPLVDYYVADVVEMTDYEPFGMQLANRHWVSGDRYRFGFNGIETDDELLGSGNAYGAYYRILDSRLGRWLSIDPKAASFSHESPYSSSFNSPILLNDPKGDCPVCPVLGEIAAGIAFVALLTSPQTLSSPTTNPAGNANGLAWGRKVQTVWTGVGLAAPLVPAMIQAAPAASSYVLARPLTSGYIAKEVLNFGMGVLAPPGAVDTDPSSYSDNLGNALKTGLSQADNLVPASDDVAGSVTRSVARPTPKMAEKNVLSAGFPEYPTQQSFKNGRQVAYGTAGSVRPEAFLDGISIEVKNYNLATREGRYALYQNISKQVRQRKSNLPAGSTQKIYLDITGQGLDPNLVRVTRSKIQTLTGSSGVEIGVFDNGKFIFGGPKAK